MQELMIKMESENILTLKEDGMRYLDRHNLLQAETCFHLILDSYQGKVGSNIQYNVTQSK